MNPLCQKQDLVIRFIKLIKLIPRKAGGEHERKKPLRLDPISKSSSNLLQNILYSIKRKIGMSNYLVEICSDQK